MLPATIAEKPSGIKSGSGGRVQKNCSGTAALLTHSWKNAYVQRNYLDHSKHIREAAAQDLEHIVRLFAQLGYATDPAQVEQQLRTLENERSGRALVAEASGALAGIAVVHLIKPIHVSAPWALLSALVVDERSRSAGIGQALLAAAEEFAMAHGCSQLELSSSSRRARAHMFYERNAYREKRLRFVKALA